MIQEGQVVLFRFPQTDQASGKLRPALVIRELLGNHEDWLICMISSQASQAIPRFDDIIREGDADFERSGLRTDSVIRIGRLAVVHHSVLLGAIGLIGQKRLSGIRERLSIWLQGK
jgi:mRNA interferase MazF